MSNGTQITEVAGVKLSPRQALFVREYLKDRNGQRSAVRAGYSETSACDLLGNPAVQSALARREREIAAKTDVTIEKVRAELGKIAFTDFTEIGSWESVNGKRGKYRLKLKDFKRLRPEQHSAIKTVRQVASGVVEVTLYDKEKALKLLAEHLGMLQPQPANAQQAIGVQIVIGDTPREVTVEQVIKDIGVDNGDE